MAAARAHFNLTHTLNTTSVQTWRHSPVPYLFGGLAAMLGLIAFALLILACSYWKLSGYFGNSEAGDLEAGQRKDENDDLGAKKTVFEEKVLVIMAGQKDPTFIATPVTSRSSSFGDSSSSKSSVSLCTCESGKLEAVVEDSKLQVTEASSENIDEQHRLGSV